MDLHLRALAETAATFRPWPQWLLGAAALGLVWRRAWHEGAVHVLVLAWQLALLQEALYWGDFLTSSG